MALAKSARQPRASVGFMTRSIKARVEYRRGVLMHTTVRRKLISSAVLAVLALGSLHTQALARQTSDQSEATAADDCHAEFAAYVGVRPYIVNPAAAKRR